jgi:phage-related protein
LGNDIFSKIRPFVDGDKKGEEEDFESTKEPKDDQEVQLIKETIHTIEAVLATAKDDRGKEFRNSFLYNICCRQFRTPFCQFTCQKFNPIFAKRRW